MTDHAETRRYSERIYGFLADNDDAHICTEISPTGCDDQPKSFVLQLFALTLMKLGDAMAGPRLVLAWMLSALGAPAIFIGLLVPLRESLALRPQLRVAQYLRERSIRKYCGVPERSRRRLEGCTASG